MTLGLGLDITDLSKNPQWLSRVAEWHHQEWLRHQPEGCLEQDHVNDENFQKRLSVLESHLNGESIPVTFVAILNGEPIGSVSLVFYQFSRNQARSPWLTNVFVQSELRVKGIGTALVEHACLHAQRVGLKSLKLYTHDKEAFYQQRGWTVVRQGQLQKQRVTIFEKQFS